MCSPSLHSSIASVSDSATANDAFGFGLSVERSLAARRSAHASIGREAGWQLTKSLRSSFSR